MKCIDCKKESRVLVVGRCQPCMMDHSRSEAFSLQSAKDAVVEAACAYVDKLGSALEPLFYAVAVLRRLQEGNPETEEEAKP